MRERRRFVLHVDLDPFCVSVERSLDPSLRGRALVIGGDGSSMGFVAAASDEARRSGVRVGMSLQQARHLAPEAVFKRGDLDTYGRVGEEVTAVLLAASRRVERPSADEAFVDLNPESHAAVAPVRAAETVRDELQRRLGLDASLGLASSRLAARVASGFAKPRGLLVVLPGYERSFVAARPVSLLDLHPHLEAALARAGFETLGQVAEAELEPLAAAVGSAAAEHVRALARCEGDGEIGLAAPPAFVQEETAVRDRASDPTALVEIVDAVARRATRRLRPFRLGAAAVAVEVRHARDSERRSSAFASATSDEEQIAAAARELARPLVEPADAVRGVLVRLARLGSESTQAPLFPVTTAFRRAL